MPRRKGKKGKRKPWERRPHEKSKAFLYFNQYKDLGPKRSLRKVTETYGDDTVKIRQLEKLCSRWGWVERAEAYDDYVTEKDSDNRIKEMERFMTSEWSQARARMGVINENIKALHEDYNNGSSNGSTISHALKSNSSAYRDGIEVMLRLAGMPSTINQNINNTELKGSLDTSVRVSDEDLLDEVKSLEDKLNKRDCDESR